MQWKISAVLWVLGGALDRFCSKEYGPLLSTEEAIAKAGQVDGLEGIEPRSSGIQTKGTSDPYVGW